MAEGNFLESVFGLKGTVALVTGASSGIGAHFARTLARAGADVVLAARRQDRISSLADEIATETGVKTLAVAMDVTSKESVEAGFKAAADALGTVTLVCNNAGMAWPKWAIDSEDEDWDATMDTNLKGMWRVATVGARAMRDAGKPGVVINTASILGLGVAPMHMTYSVSKAGVVQMTKAMAIEFNRMGVRVNALCPGYFKTEINDDFLETDQGKAMVAHTPARRVGNLKELEAPLLALAGPGGSFMAGVALPVDGGQCVVV